MFIDFRYKLPSYRLEGKNNGQYNNPELLLPGLLTTKDYKLGEFMHGLHNIIADERRLVFVDGEVISCSHNWVRDHVHMMKSFKHWDYDLKSFLKFIIDRQNDEGFFYELIKQLDDNHHEYVSDNYRIIYQNDNLALTRLEIEADVEYLVVDGCYQYYKATGDKGFIGEVLPKLEKSIEYMMTSPNRFDENLKLIKRAFTIDTWDFTNSVSSGTDRRIHDDENFSIMHGDNSGVYNAMNILSYFNKILGDDEKSAYWKNGADELRGNIFNHLWNGKYFIHQLHINHKGIDDLENIRLSLSNSYDINRGLTSISQSRSIIEEYLKRKADQNFFAEWFSINPPYKKFNRYTEGQYVNGGITPLVAGELALASFNNGYEEYGYDIIKRLMELYYKDGKIHFVYSPSGNQKESNSGPSGWGASSILNAIDEGLAGIVDKDCLYNEIDFSPRFVVTEYDELRYFTGYESSKRYIDLRFTINENGMRYDIYSKAKRINAHILLPKNRKCGSLYVNGAKFEYVSVLVGTSNYIDFAIDEGEAQIEILFE